METRASWAGGAFGDADAHTFLHVVVQRLADRVVDRCAELAQYRNLAKQGFEPAVASGADDQPGAPFAQASSTHATELPMIR